MVLSEKLFKRAGYPMVFLFPGAIVCALAGQTGMSPVGFLVANVAGTLTAVLAVRRFSATIATPVEALLGFFNRHLVATTSVTVALVVASVVLNRAQGKLGADLDTLEQPGGRGSDLEQGVEADGDAGVGGDRLHRQQDTGHE